MLTRTEKLLKDIDPAHQVGVEIGPLVNPVVTRQMGQIRYVDHDTTAALRLKYADNPTIDVNKIVDVDYVWGEKSLAELTQAEAPFDYLIASHVIEHVPDLVGWLTEIRRILKPGGILSLAIPDKRQCFDYKRQITQLCEVLEAYLYRNKRPSPRQIFDHFATAVTNEQGAWVWSEKLAETAEFNPIDSLSTAWDITQQAFTTGNYCDAHCWVFTPTSFFRLLADLAELALLKFEVVQFYDTEGCEFLVSLRAVENFVDRSTIPIPLAAESQLNQPDPQPELPVLAERHHQEKLRLAARIQAMESSKFWQLRTAWFKVKGKLIWPVQ